MTVQFLNCPYNHSIEVKVDIAVQCVVLKRRKEGNVLFNNTLNTFYLLKLLLYGVRHMVKNHSASERGRKPLTLSD